RKPVEVDRRAGVGAVAVSIHPDAEETGRLDLESRLLPQLANGRVERVLALFREAARDVPLPVLDLGSATCEQEPPVVVDDESAGGRSRVRVDDVSAAAAFDAAGLGTEVAGTPRTEPPAMQHRHPPTFTSPPTSSEEVVPWRILRPRLTKGTSRGPTGARTRRRCAGLGTTIRRT